MNSIGYTRNWKVLSVVENKLQFVDLEWLSSLQFRPNSFNVFKHVRSWTPSCLNRLCLEDYDSHMVACNVVRNDVNLHFLLLDKFPMVSRTKRTRLPKNTGGGVSIGILETT
jgi:hypothetical protein